MPTPYKVLSRSSEITPPTTPEGSGSIPAPGSAVVPEFGPGEIVSHITDESTRGVIVAFMVRGKNHSYQVQWGVEKCEWHLDFEIRRVPEPPKPIGFWAANGWSKD